MINDGRLKGEKFQLRCCLTDSYRAPVDPEEQRERKREATLSRAAEWTKYSPPPSQWRCDTFRQFLTLFTRPIEHSQNHPKAIYLTLIMLSWKLPCNISKHSSYQLSLSEKCSLQIINIFLSLQRLSTLMSIQDSRP